MGLEYEIKLIPKQEKKFLLLEEYFRQEGRHYDMQTAYYDTPARDLRKRGITLRKRMENDKAICTIKTPAEKGRNEYELECSCIEDAIPKLCRLAQMPELTALLQKGVEQVCGAVFHRTSVYINLSDSVVDVCFDRGQLLGGSKTAPLMEMEIELVYGSPRGVDRLANGVCVAHDFEEEKRNKYARAYTLAEER